MDPKVLAEQSSREMESLLSCPICLETFTKPVVILPCQHNLCRGCAEDCFDQRGFRFGVSGGRFKCPTCRYEVILDRHGVMGLPRNLLVENIIDMMEDDKKKVENKYKEKIQVEELKLEKLKKQERDVEAARENKLCADHKESLNVYCLSCAKLICATCKVFGECQSCTVVRMEQAYDQQQQEMREAIELITNSSERVHQAITHVTDLKKRTDEVDCDARTQLLAQFDKIFTALESKKQQLLGKINMVTGDTTKILITHKTKYTDALEAANNEINEALGLTSEEDHIIFLRQARPLIDKMLKNQCQLEARPPPITPPSGSKWKIDLAPLVEVVKKIDFSSDIRFKQSSSKNQGSRSGNISNTNAHSNSNANNNINTNDSSVSSPKQSSSRSATSKSAGKIDEEGKTNVISLVNSEINSLDTVDDGVSVKSFEKQKKTSTFDKLQSMMLGTNIHGKKGSRQAAGNSLITSSASIGSDKFVDCDEEEVIYQ